MTRLAIKDKTFIRNNIQKPVKAIIGFDANALYLNSEGSPMPTGFHDLWIINQYNCQQFIKKHNSFHISNEWLEYQAWKSAVEIQHLGNGKEKRIGIRRLPVDGYCKQNNTIYEFYGCYFHSHDCSIGVKNKNKKHKDAKMWIDEKEEYIKSHGYQIIKIWECAWLKERESYISRRKLQDPNFFCVYKDKNSISYEEMKQSIINGSVFGYAKVDIYTPENLKEKFSDFPPIIKHATIGREHIGDHMRQYAEQTQQLKQPRKNLISSYSASKMVLFTPMIQFLVNHGLILKKIYFVIQYDKTTPFGWFKDIVTENRLRGMDLKFTLIII